MSKFFHTSDKIPCVVSELTLQNGNGKPKPVSPFGPDVSHAGLQRNCAMSLNRIGKTREFVCENTDGHAAFPPAWDQFKLYLIGNRLVGTKPMTIGESRYLIEISTLELPFGDLIQCTYTALDPTKEDDGTWHAPPPH